MAAAQFGLGAVGRIEDVPAPRDVALRRQRVRGRREPDPGEAGRLDRGRVLLNNPIPALLTPRNVVERPGVRTPVEALEEDVAAVAVVLPFIRPDSGRPRAAPTTATQGALNSVCIGIMALDQGVNNVVNAKGRNRSIGTDGWIGA